VRNRSRSLFLPLVLLLLPGPRASAAEVPLESFVDRVDVDVVNVEVFVTDRDGRHVAGLRREDFVVFEDDQRVEITNFYAVARGAGEGAEPVPEGISPDPEMWPVPEDQRLHLVVYVDNYNLRPTHRARVLEALSGFLEDCLAASARVMLVAHNGSLEVVQPFTDDHRRLAAGLGKLGRATTHLPEVDARRRAAIRMIDRALVDGDLTSSRSHLDGYVQILRSEVQRSVRALESVVRALGILPGRKAILYLSDGLETYPGRDLEEMFFGVSAGGGESHLFRRLSREANAQQVTFYTLDARGQLTPRQSAEFSAQDLGGDAVEINRLFHLAEPLLAISGPTGGSTILNTFNFAGTLSQVSEDFGNFYSLGYRSRDSGQGKYHKIEVKLRRPGLWLRHRSGYFDKPAAERVADRTLSVLLVDGARNPLGVAVAFGEAEKEGRHKFLLPILVRIPFQGVTLLPRDEMMEGRLRLFVTVRDEQDRLSPVRELAYPLSVARDELEKAPGGDIGYQATLEIRPGTQQVAVGVWDEISGAESFVRESVVVGEPEK